MMYLPPPNPTSNTSKPQILLPNLNMKAVTWNIKGANSMAFLPHAKDIIRTYNHSILVLFETKASMEHALSTTHSLNF